jgi:hypothetical protein
MSDRDILSKLKENRTKVIVYSRCMGYHRPIESFNIGKKGEHRQRVFFTEDCCKGKIEATKI